MPEWLVTLLTSVATLLVTLTVTLLFNKFIEIPKKLKNQEEKNRCKEDQQKQENQARDIKIAALEQAVNNLPVYRAQSL